MSQPTYQTGTIPPETMGWRLQRSLAFADVSVEQMAAELGVSRSTVSRWLNDRGTPSLGYLKVWALRCGVPLDWLRHGNLQVVADGDWGPPMLTDPDIPSDSSVEHARPPSRAEILAHRKALPLLRAVYGDRAVASR